MYSNDEVTGVYGFLKSTGEGNLKKMLVNGKFTDNHLKILLKIVRGVTESEFVVHFEQSTFPKIKLSPPEIALKETFWPQATQAFAQMGLLTQKKAA